MLAASYRQFRYSADFLASLAIAGTDGTLRRRMSSGAAARQVRAKTGTLDTVSALSGYAGVDSRAPLVFSILVNDLPANSSRAGQARQLQDEIAELLVVYAAAQATPDRD